MVIGSMTMYQVLWFFMIYSILGWGAEVAYHALTMGKVINRGFLNGPMCPIYGFGMLSILMVFNSISEEPGGNNAFALFLGGAALATSIELFGGWMLDKLFHLRWWDYTDEPFNLHGYICLKFSVIWGLGTVFIYRIVHPTIAALTVSLLPAAVGWVLLAISYGGFVIDLCVTVATVRGLNRDLAELDELRKKLRVVSDSMSEQIGVNTIRTANAIEETRLQASLAGAELKEKAQEFSDELKEYKAMPPAERTAYAALKKQELREYAEKKAEEIGDRAAFKAGEMQGYLDSVRMEQEARTEELQQARVRQYERDQEELDRQFAGLEKRRREQEARYEELRLRYEAARSRIYRHSVFGTARLLKAFPRAVHREHNELLQELRRKLADREAAGSTADEAYVNGTPGGEKDKRPVN